MTNHFHWVIETPEGKVGPGNAAAQRRVHSALQSSAWEDRARLPGAVQGDSRGERQLLQETLPLRGAQPGTRYHGKSTRGVAVEQLSGDNEARVWATMVECRLALGAILEGPGTGLCCLPLFCS
jgi:hypothetical protein